jgi:hypothetical protein
VESPEPEFARATNCSGKPGPMEAPTPYKKKEAQIDIQAVAKIQYPIKSLNTKAKYGPIYF